VIVLYYCWELSNEKATILRCWRRGSAHRDTRTVKPTLQVSRSSPTFLPSFRPSACSSSRRSVVLGLERPALTVISNLPVRRDDRQFNWPAVTATSRATDRRQIELYNVVGLGQYFTAATASVGSLDRVRRGCSSRRSRRVVIGLSASISRFPAARYLNREWAENERKTMHNCTGQLRLRRLAPPPALQFDRAFDHNSYVDFDLCSRCRFSVFLSIIFKSVLSVFGFATLPRSQGGRIMCCTLSGCLSVCPSFCLAPSIYSKPKSRTDFKYEKDVT